jgi:Concanavalin A-like lectin/glucanases superfamily
MPVEGISMTTVFSLTVVGLALALSTYIGGYYLRPLFDIDALITSVAYDIATMYDLAYTLPGEVTMQYFGPRSCKWNFMKSSNDVKAFYCIDPSTVVIKSVNLNKQYLLVYDDIYLDHDSKNPLITNWIIDYMGIASMAKAIGYPRITYLTIEIPYYNRQVSKQTDFARGKIGYGSLAVAPFAGSYTDNAMTAAKTPYDVEVKDYSFIVKKTKVGNYYYTLSDFDDTPMELATFINYLSGVYSTICSLNSVESGYYVFPVYSQRLWLNESPLLITPILYEDLTNLTLTATSFLKKNPSFLMLSKGNKIKAYNNDLNSEKLNDLWTFDNGPYSSLSKNDLIVSGAVLADGLFSNAYKFDGVDDKISTNGDFNLNKFSISAWIYLKDYTYTSWGSMIASKTNGVSTGFALFVNVGTHKPWFRTMNGTIPASDTHDAVGSEIILPKRWYHLVGVYNGTHNLLYVNSELQSVVYSKMNYEATKSLTMGGSSWGSHGYVNGLIDDVKIFNLALDQEDVKTLHSSISKNSICSENIRLTLDEDELYNELYDYWNFNEDNGGTKVLSALGKNNFTKHNTPYVDFSDNEDLKLTAIANTLTSSYLSSEVNPTFDEFSISFYMKLGVLGKYQYIISTNRDWCPAPTDSVPACTDIVGYSVRVNTNNQIQFHFANSYSNQDVLTSSYAAPLNQWIHVIVTYNQEKAKIYINGILNNEKTTLVSYIPSPSYNLTIGTLAPVAPTYYSYTGSIDEIKIFKKELSDSEANYVYSHPKSLVINELLDNMKINDYIGDYCFDVNELTKRNKCENIKEVIISPEFIQKINSQTNFYAGWNSCIYPYFFYNTTSKKLIINAINSDYNLIRGGCDVNE